MNNKKQSSQSSLIDAAIVNGDRSIDYKKEQETKLQITAKNKTVLTKNQQAFNRLTRQIEKLELEIETDTKRFDTLTETHANKLLGLEAETAQAQINLAFLFDRATAQYKFTQSQIKHIQGCIVGILDMAFCTIVPTPEQEALFDKWSESTYREELERQESDESSPLSEMFEAFFGKDFLDDDGNISSSEEFEDETSEGDSGKKPKFKNKTKRQLEQEESLRAEQELKNKSLRSIYISLAKVLHPDSETDPEQKLAKEQVMKQVTVAYEQKDLKMLLKLEMEWVHQTKDHLDQLSDDKLKNYIAVLKEQVEQLKNEKYSLRDNPRYQSIRELLYLTEKQALRQIHNQIKLYNQTIEHVATMSEMITKSPTKTGIAKIAKDFNTAMEIINESHSRDYIDDFFF